MQVAQVRQAVGPQQHTECCKAVLQLRVIRVIPYPFQCDHLLLLGLRVRWVSGRSCAERPNHSPGVVLLAKVRHICIHWLTYLADLALDFIVCSCKVQHFCRASVKSLFDGYVRAQAYFIFASASLPTLSCSGLGAEMQNSTYLGNSYAPILVPCQLHSCKVYRCIHAALPDETDCIGRSTMSWIHSNYIPKRAEAAGPRASFVQNVQVFDSGIPNTRLDKSFFEDLEAGLDMFVRMNSRSIECFSGTSVTMTSTTLPPVMTLTFSSTLVSAVILASNLVQSLSKFLVTSRLLATELLRCDRFPKHFLSPFTHTILISMSQCRQEERPWHAVLVLRWLVNSPRVVQPLPWEIGSACTFCSRWFELFWIYPASCPAVSTYRVQGTIRGIRRVLCDSLWSMTLFVWVCSALQCFECEWSETLWFWDPNHVQNDLHNIYSCLAVELSWCKRLMIVCCLFWHLGYFRILSLFVAHVGQHWLRRRKQTRWHRPQLTGRTITSLLLVLETQMSSDIHDLSTNEELFCYDAWERWPQGSCPVTMDRLYQHQIWLWRCDLRAGHVHLLHQPFRTSWRPRNVPLSSTVSIAPKSKELEQPVLRVRHDLTISSVAHHFLPWQLCPCRNARAI